MVLQMIHIKRAFRESADPRQNTANHVTMTIFLISFLYFLSTSVYSYFMFGDIWNGMYFVDTDLQIIELTGRYTLPLVNAALFPTILILRKPELRARYRGYILTVLHMPVSVFYRLHRRSGYAEI